MYTCIDLVLDYLREDGLITEEFFNEKMSMNAQEQCSPFEGVQPPEVPRSERETRTYTKMIDIGPMQVCVYVNIQLYTWIHFIQIRF